MDDDFLDFGRRMTDFLALIDETFSEEPPVTFGYRTRGGASPRGKAKVYFTCHPEDFSLYFERIAEDVLRAADCAVYYTEDMTAKIPAKAKETDLGGMNLFLVPVTFRLLDEPSRAMQEDIAYAKQQNIPILPFMMETGLDTLYARPECFGERQYLEPNSTDLTQIDYTEKLRKRLSSLLTDSETVKRVREAFDAHVFLSYRKKDRYHANELMRLIHGDPRYRDVAIWYDEFIVPGNSFKEDIDEALDKCNLFALLVTPNLLEVTDGIPNFVMREEYPAAQKAHKPILPTEMVTTDRRELQEKFPGLPDCVFPQAEDDFYSALAKCLNPITDAKNDEDPEHLFLIGIAYRDGIDVEVDRERGVALITQAAEAGLPIAMEILSGMYADGVGVPLDYRKATAWCECVVAHYLRTEGESENLLDTLALLAYMYNRNGNVQDYLNISRKLVALRSKYYGNEDKRTLASRFDLANAYAYMGDYEKTLQICKELYEECAATLGLEHSDTHAVSVLMGQAYTMLGMYETAQSVYEETFALLRQSVGEESKECTQLMSRLALLYSLTGRFTDALSVTERTYELCCKVYGEKHPETLVELNNLGSLSFRLGETEKAFKILRDVYGQMCDVLGAQHPNTLRTQAVLAAVYNEKGDSRTAFAMVQEAYAGLCRVLGEEHNETLIALNLLSEVRHKNGDDKGAMADLEQLYNAYRKLYGEDHEDTQTVLQTLLMFKRRFSRQESVAPDTQDEENLSHEDRVMIPMKEAQELLDAGDYESALARMEIAYILADALLGAEHATTKRITKYLDALRNLI